MNRSIQVLKDSQLKNSLSLGLGSYIIGRDPSSDIVISDSSVSKRHAILIIDENGFLLKDTNSVNGLHYKGKRFSEKRFGSDFSVAIGPFVLTGSSGQRREKTGITGGGPGLVRKIMLANLKTSMFVLMTLLMLLTFFIVYKPFKKEVIEIKQQELLRTGILLSRYLAEINRFFLQTNQYSQVKLTPVNQEHGVIYAFILDSHGRIIAPRESQGNFFNWSGLTAAFKNAKLTMEDGKKNEKIIFNPILQQNRVVGASVIGYSYKKLAGESSAGFGGTVFILLILILCLGALTSYLLVRSILKPLNHLYEEVELAVKEGRTGIEYQSTYKELDNLKLTFDRLLMRKSVHTETKADLYQAATPEPIPHKETPSPKPEPTPATAPEARKVPEKNSSVQFDKLNDIWCIVDRESYTLEDFSKTFSLGSSKLDLKQGMHLIEAFDTDVIQAVSFLMDSPDEYEQDFSFENREYTIHRMEGISSSNKVTLVFKDRQ